MGGGGGAVVDGGGRRGGVAGDRAVRDQVRGGGDPVQRRRHRRLLRPLRAPAGPSHRLRQGNSFMYIYILCPNDRCINAM